MSRYDATGDQGNFEPGSDGQVLANKLQLTSPEEMDEVELVLLEKLYEAVLLQDFPDRRLTVADLQRWHRQWLGNVYTWAGEQRSVNLAKGDFPFAAVTQIPRLLNQFETEYLGQFTPCHGVEREPLERAIAVTHVELILIHPFREGNGRLARLLADVMAVQAGVDPLDYGVWDAEKDLYFSAIQKGMLKEYEPMVQLVERAITS